MTHRTTNVVAVSLAALALTALDGEKGALTIADAAPKQPPCVGCSIDGKMPRTADGHPDLNGYWHGSPNAARGGGSGGFGGRAVQRYSDGSIVFDFSTKYNDEDGIGRICQSDDCQAPNQPPYNDEWMAKVRKIAETEFGGTTPLDPVQDCRPLGVPRAGVNGITIVQNSQTIAVLYEEAPYSTYRIIYMDGRPHPDPEDLETSFFGHSIGSWDGDTLVVDVVGLTTDSWVGGGGPIGRSRYTSIHSDQMHVIERWTREGDVLTYEATVEDPVAFKRPWVIAPRRVAHAGAGEEPYENICTPIGKEHYVPPNADDPDVKKLCGYRCESDLPDKAALEPATVMITGAWQTTTTFPDRAAKEQWTIQQDGNVVTATAKGDHGPMPVSGSVEGAFMRVTVHDGERDYKVRATVDGDTMDGSITLDVGEQYLWQAMRVR
jgi:hypothetical protein